VIMLGTFLHCRNACYSYSEASGKRKMVKLNAEFMKEQILKTSCYTTTPRVPCPEMKYDTQISVIEGDCIEVALMLKERGLHPLVLNMANSKQPGGGYRSGNGAQEENLHRRSNYYQSLEDPEGIQPAGGASHYPISPEGAIYSPNIVVFRASEAKGYGFLNPPHLLSFIACPALARPTLLWTKQGPRMSDIHVEATKAKVRTILGVGLLHSHDSLVLSAFGCGAFKCPPQHVAELFKQVIEEEFSHHYKHIAFAIFDDHNSRKRHNPEGNVKPFADVFGVPVQKME